MKSDWERLKLLAHGEVEATIAELPAPLREHAARLPVTLEHVPHPDFVAEGIEADSLGLFTGPAFGEEDLSASPVPPQIFLFLDNLWNFAEGDEKIYLEEVHTTYLHELGHYLGLDEDDLFERGLE
jgi:predicted Zn-dependent protease with MMP-like domain